MIQNTFTQKDLSIYDFEYDQNDLIPYTHDGFEYLIPKSDEKIYKFIDAECNINRTNIMSNNCDNRLFISSYENPDLLLNLYSIVSPDFLDEEDKSHKVYLYCEGIRVPLRCQESEVSFMDLGYIFDDFLSDYPMGNYFILIPGFASDDKSGKFCQMGNCLKYSFRILPKGSTLAHPRISRPEVAPIGNKTKFKSGSLSISFKTDIPSKECDVYTLSCYNKDMFLMGKAHICASPRNKTFNTRLSSSFIWTPGEYNCYIEHNDEPIYNLSFTISDNNEFSCKMFPVKRHSDSYNMLKHIEKESFNWSALRDNPGCTLLKESYIKNFRRRELDRKRDKMGLSMICDNLNYFIIVNKTDDNPRSVTDFAQALSTKHSVANYDCNKLMKDDENDRANDKIDSAFSTSDDYIMCLKGISGLNSAKGSYILSRIEQRLSEKLYHPLILSGTEAEMELFFELSPNLKNYYPDTNILRLSNYSCNELIHLFQKEIEALDLQLSPEAEDHITRCISEAYSAKKFSNWGISDIKNFINRSIIPRFSSRMARKKYISAETLKVLECSDIDFSDISTGNDAFNISVEKLNRMVGLKNLKARLISTFNHTKFNTLRQEYGLKSALTSCHHMIFTGNPGTGKTTVAKMIGNIYHALGILSVGDVVITERSRMVGRYLGETEQNMNLLLQQAKGNVLFVDEAYTLYDGSDDHKDYGYHALECLLTVLSQKNPDMIVIFAGYKNEIDKMMQANQGLRGRFPYHFHFDDYSADELLLIAKNIIAEEQYKLTNDAEVRLAETIRESVDAKGEDFSNARWIDQYVKNGIIPAVGDRLIAGSSIIDKESCQTITRNDVENAYTNFAPAHTASNAKEMLPFSKFHNLPRVGFKIA